MAGQKSNLPQVGLAKSTSKKYKLKRFSNKKKKEFSKVLLIQESILVWLVTISFIVLAFVCVYNSYFGELPWLATLTASVWGAYGVSQAFYYNKAKAENTKNGIKYETTMAEYLPEIPEAKG